MSVNPREHRKHVVTALLCVFPLLFSGCFGPARASVELLRQAEALGAENRWTEARALVKTYVLDHPEKVDGHYLLGLSYLHVPDDFEIQGRGELLVAARLFERTGDLGMLADSMTPEQFRTLFHQKTALTYMRSIRRLLMVAVPAELLEGQIREALRHVDWGLELEPDNAFMQGMKETLETGIADLRRQLEAPVPDAKPFPLAPIPRQSPLV